MGERPHQICTRCIMDTTDPEIEFDGQGVCNHCRGYEAYAREALLTGEQARLALSGIVSEIRRSGEGRDYDCVIGVSGGVDSTYVAYKVKELGLRPLAVHFDNGWDSEIAVKNIENLVRKLDIDLYTWVVDWEEFRDLQLAYLRAGVPNLEAPSDHGIWAAVYHVAATRNIRYVISGHNAATEGILPWSWGYTPKDLRQIRAIHRRLGTRRLRTFPQASFFRFLYYIYAKKIRRVSILNYMEYVKSDVLNVITGELGWRNYGGKHYESVYTRFFQGYILPMRFGYDKRRAHLSTLICSGQLTRDEALATFARNEYVESRQALEDRDYVIKKLGVSDAEFESFLDMPRHTHRDYPSSRLFYENLSEITRVFRMLGIRYR